MNLSFHTRKKEAGHHIYLLLLRKIQRRKDVEKLLDTLKRAELMSTFILYNLDIQYF